MDGGRDDGAGDDEHRQDGSKSGYGEEGFKARMTDTHVFYAARCSRKTAAAIYAFLRPYTYPVENLNAA